MIAPEDLVRTKSHFEETMAGHTQSFELSCFHRSGNRLAISLTCVPIVSGNLTIGFYGIARDITERLFTQDMLTSSRNELVKLQDAFHLMAENCRICSL